MLGQRCWNDNDGCGGRKRWLNNNHANIHNHYVLFSKINIENSLDTHIYAMRISVDQWHIRADVLYCFVCLRALHLFLGLRSFSEAVLEPACHGLHVAHAPGARRATGLGLQCPIEVTHLGGGIPARRAHLLPEVVGHIPTSPARGVWLVVLLTERSCTFSLSCHKKGKEAEKERIQELEINVAKP